MVRHVWAATRQALVMSLFPRPNEVRCHLGASHWKWWVTHPKNRQWGFSWFFGLLTPAHQPVKALGVKPRELGEKCACWFTYSSLPPYWEPLVCVCTCTCVEGHTEVNKWTHQSLTRLGENRASTSSNQPQNHSHRPRILSLTFKLLLWAHTPLLPLTEGCGKHLSVSSPDGGA